MTRIATCVHCNKRLSRGPLLVGATCGLISLAAAARTLGADTFDGAYTGTRVLTKGSSQRCEPSEDVSVTINGGALTVTDSALHDYSIGFNPHQDGSFDLITADSRGLARSSRVASWGTLWTLMSSTAHASTTGI